MCVYTHLSLDIHTCTHITHDTHIQTHFYLGWHILMYSTFLYILVLSLKWRLYNSLFMSIYFPQCQVPKHFCLCEFLMSFFWVVYWYVSPGLTCMLLQVMEVNQCPFLLNFLCLAKESPDNKEKKFKSLQNSFDTQKQKNPYFSNLQI